MNQPKAAPASCAVCSKDPQAFPQSRVKRYASVTSTPIPAKMKATPPGSTEICEAACYDCLLSYSNQPEHRLLDRKAIREILLDFQRSTVSIAPAAKPRSEHLIQLKRLCGSKLEEAWLDFLEANDYHLPSGAQQFLQVCQTRPDFFYEQHNVAIYVDGPPHEYPERKQRDAAQQDCMDDHGYVVIRFAHKDDWVTILKKYPNIFGSGK